MSGPREGEARRLDVPPGLHRACPDTELWLTGAALLPPGSAAPGSEPAAADLALLDDGERERAARLRRPADRHLYVTAHALLRRLLGARLGRDPAALRFVREPCPGCGDPHGRPALPDTPVHFSLSHSGGLALIGTAGRPLGVDVEERTGGAVADDLAASLHPGERGQLAALPPGPARDAAFARCWTRKEACLKGTGAGLTEGGLRDVHVGAGPEPEPVPGWALADLPLPAGDAGACAVRRTP